MATIKNSVKSEMGERLLRLITDHASALRLLDAFVSSGANADFDALWIHIFDHGRRDRWGTRDLQALELFLERRAREGDSLIEWADRLEHAAKTNPCLVSLAGWASYLSKAKVLSDADIIQKFPPPLLQDPRRGIRIAADFLEAGRGECVLDYLRFSSRLKATPQQLAKITRLFDRLATEHPREVSGLVKVRVALLGGMTTLQFGPILRAMALTRGFNIQTYEAEYNSFETEILDTGSGLYKFRPEIVLLLPVKEHLPWKTIEADHEDLVGQEIQRWQTLWAKVIEVTGARILHGTYESGSAEGSLHLDLRHPGSRRSLIRKVNQHLASHAPAGVHMIDVEAIASYVGKSVWHSDKYWYLAKQPIVLEHVPRLMRHVVGVMAGLMGRSLRCVVIDLDNTLWGGVLADVGPEGILSGQGDPVAEAHYAFQRYIKSLSSRGIALAICSKNDEANVRRAFEVRAGDLALTMSDFAAVRINWEDKAANIAALSEELGLGTEHFVFVDDDSGQRNRVRLAYPEIVVPELPEDPSEYCAALESELLFEITELTTEDLDRSRMYRADRERRSVKAEAQSLEDYLQALSMVMEVKSLDEALLPRVAQLVAKTNQFNLTTRRYSDAELRLMMSDSTVEVLGFRLVDRFGDNGWIGVLILRESCDTLLEIDTWLMSCRVLGRNVEQFMVSEIMAVARRRGRPRLKAMYVPSQKNGMVRDHYLRLGFSPVVGGDDGKLQFEASLDQLKAGASSIRRKQ